MASIANHATLRELEHIHDRLNYLEASIFGGMLDKAKSMFSSTLTPHAISDYIHKKYKVEVAKDGDGKLDFAMGDAKFEITKGSDGKMFMITKDGGSGMPFSKLSDLDTLMKSLTHSAGMSSRAQPTAEELARYSRAVMRSQALRG